MLCIRPGTGLIYNQDQAAVQTCSGPDTMARMQRKAQSGASFIARLQCNALSRTRLYVQATRLYLEPGPGSMARLQGSI